MFCLVLFKDVHIVVECVYYLLNYFNNLLIVNVSCCCCSLCWNHSAIMKPLYVVKWCSCYGTIEYCWSTRINYLYLRVNMNRQIWIYVQTNFNLLISELIWCFANLKKNEKLFSPSTLLLKIIMTTYMEYLLNFWFLDKTFVFHVLFYQQKKSKIF